MTGRDWLPELPLGWQAQRADAVLEYRKTPARTAEFESVDVLHYSIPSIQETGDGVVQNGSEIESDKIRLDGGELIVSKLNPRKGCVLLTRPQSLPIVCSTEFVPLAARPGFDSRFAFYVYVSTPIRELISAVVQSVTRSHQRANPDDITKIWIPVPPPIEQRAIADYLDRETARLDALVAAKERVLGLLAEKRRALITRAVTRGLEPRAPLRVSGIPWLGEIPAHWVATRLKFVADVRGGITIGQRYGTTDLIEMPYLRVANVQDARLDLTEVATVLLPRDELAVCMLEAGDVLMNEGGDADKLGRGCVWRGEIERCLHQNHVFAVRPRHVLSDWLSIWTSTDGAKAFFESRAKQSTNLASISASNINELPIPLPPPEEQGAIVDHVNDVSAKLDALRSATERTVGLLKERRAALIAAVVTGQIDVRSSS